MTRVFFFWRLRNHVFRYHNNNLIFGGTHGKVFHGINEDGRARYASRGSPIDTMGTHKIDNLPGNGVSNRRWFRVGIHHRHNLNCGFGRDDQENLFSEGY
jgi:hypothetical protein